MSRALVVYHTSLTLEFELCSSRASSSSIRFWLLLFFHAVQKEFRTRLNAFSRQYHRQRATVLSQIIYPLVSSISLSSVWCSRFQRIFSRSELFKPRINSTLISCVEFYTQLQWFCFQFWFHCGISWTYITDLLLFFFFGCCYRSVTLNTYIPFHRTDYTEIDWWKEVHIRETNGWLIRSRT